MLVLSRKIGEELVIGDNIRIVVSRVAGNRVSLGIQAPDSVHIIRSELQEIREEFGQRDESQLNLYRPTATPLDLTPNLNVTPRTNSQSNL